MLWNLPFIVVIATTMIGLVTILYKQNLIKVLLGINILQSAANLFLIALGYRAGGVAPIFTLAPSTQMVLPTPGPLSHVDCYRSCHQCPAPLICNHHPQEVRHC